MAREQARTVRAEAGSECLAGDFATGLDGCGGTAKVAGVGPAGDPYFAGLANRDTVASRLLVGAAEISGHRHGVKIRGDLGHISGVTPGVCFADQVVFLEGVGRDGEQHGTGGAANINATGGVHGDGGGRFAIGVAGGDHHAGLEQDAIAGDLHDAGVDGRARHRRRLARDIDVALRVHGNRSEAADVGGGKQNALAGGVEFGNEAARHGGVAPARGNYGFRKVVGAIAHHPGVARGIDGDSPTVIVARAAEITGVGSRWPSAVNLATKASVSPPANFRLEVLDVPARPAQPVPTTYMPPCGSSATPATSSEQLVPM